MRIIFLSFLMFQLTNICFASEQPPKSNFCVNKFYSLISKRVDPKSKISISKIDTAIQQTLKDCQKAEPALLDKALDNAIKEKNKDIIIHIVTLQNQQSIRRDIAKEQFWRNLGATALAAASGFLFGYVIHQQNKVESKKK